MGLVANPLDHLGEAEPGCTVPRPMRGRVSYPYISQVVGVGVVKRDVPVRLAEIASPPVVLSPVQAGRLLGLGRTPVYRPLHEGAFPVPVRRGGRSRMVPTVGLLTYLGLDTLATSTVTTGGGGGCGARVNAEEKARTIDGST